MQTSTSLNYGLIITTLSRVIGEVRKLYIPWNGRLLSSANSWFAQNSASYTQLKGLKNIVDKIQNYLEGSIEDNGNLFNILQSKQLVS